MVMSPPIPSIETSPLPWSVEGAEICPPALISFLTTPSAACAVNCTLPRGADSLPVLVLVTSNASLATSPAPTASVIWKLIRPSPYRSIV
ncbi:hypothetical protein GLUCOINTEAF2_0203019 [Komagataeibacter intermedius AF2]|uniref:Uncharacterized protein n=1 Tax=Komagataeibacter intermedius AF2 TaxID=1458464 RepID=A0A0N1N3U0_9PROT|nr:hypothetical protein GLUCOINTEAF2_0203019 [Komagataeibacter intermedius AF2]